MLVLCEECRNHYDDECQASECAGVGRTEGFRDGIASSHAVLRDETAIEAHASNTRAARTSGPLGPRGPRGPLGVSVNPATITPTGQHTVPMAPSADAAP